MANTDQPSQHQWNFTAPAESRWSRPLLIGGIGVALSLVGIAHVWQSPPASTPQAAAIIPQPAPAVEKNPVEPQQTSVVRQRDTQPKPRQQPRTPTLVAEPTVTQPQPPAQPLDAMQGTWQLNDLVTQLKGQKEISAEKIKNIKQLLRELRKQGVAAVPAIREFLRQKSDVNFAKMKGGELLDHATLRQALMSTLHKIGGKESQAVSLEVLSSTQDPVEIALLARNLENEAPDVYREAVLQTINNALVSWTGAKDPVEMRPLFELLQDLGGREVAAILAQFPANADSVQYLRNRNSQIDPTVRLYALLALTDLPDGKGIPNLTALASDPTVPVQHKPALPFRMLAQSALSYNEAGQSLVDLAKAGQIPENAWREVSEALKGNYLRFPSPSPSMETSYPQPYYDENHKIRYEQHLVSADWSPKQVNQQIALIDNLLQATTSPTAKQALQQARVSLER